MPRSDRGLPITGGPHYDPIRPYVLYRLLPRANGAQRLLLLRLLLLRLRLFLECGGNLERYVVADDRHAIA